MSWVFSRCHSKDGISSSVSRRIYSIRLSASLPAVQVITESAHSSRLAQAGKLFSSSSSSFLPCCAQDTHLGTLFQIACTNLESAWTEFHSSIAAAWLCGVCGEELINLSISFSHGVHCWDFWAVRRCCLVEANLHLASDKLYQACFCLVLLCSVH